MKLDKNETKAFLFAIGDYNRFSILAALLERDMCVNEIVEDTGMEQSNVSHHLICLANCGFVKVKRDGKKRIYSINEDVKPMIEGMLEHIKAYKNRILSCNVANKAYVSKVILKKGK